MENQPEYLVSVAHADGKKITTYRSIIQPQIGDEVVIMNGTLKVERRVITGDLGYSILIMGTLSPNRLTF